MWRALSSGDQANDDGGSGTSGNITSTSYTIQELESNTIYSVTVTVTNAAGSTVSQPIIITSMCFCHTHFERSLICWYPLFQYSVPTVHQSDSQTYIAAALTGGLVTVVLIIAVTVIVIVVLLLRNRRGHYSPGIQRLYVIIKLWRSLYISFSCAEVK